MTNPGADVNNWFWVPLLSGISANVGSSGFRLMIYWQMMV
jgi:hypothetical protein